MKKFKKYPKFNAQYKELRFETKEKFQEWLKTKSFAVIKFKDYGQDLLSIHIDEEGEILYTNIPSMGVVYNGKIVATDRLEVGDFLWLSDSQKMADIQTDFIIESIV